jgi:hypothetical protein
MKTDYGKIRLRYARQCHGGEWENLDYPVRLQTTACHYRGQRYGFTCPIRGCGRRVALLYLGAAYLACRDCYRLTYRSQRESKEDRAARRADKIRHKLNWKRGILNSEGDKPKGMHWKTFHRLIKKHDDFVKQSLIGIMARLKIFL